jgi:DNA-binding protein H-NS
MMVENRISGGAPVVRDEFANLSDLELLSLMKRAEQELELLESKSKDKLKQEVLERLRSAGLHIGELFPEAAAKRKREISDPGEGKPVLAKYRDPVSQETWSGRSARPPLLMKRIMAERGWMLGEFKRSGEYDV